MLVLGAAEAWGQCATFGSFDLGDDIEVTCEDSCLTLIAPGIASVASGGGSEYDVDPIPYDPPYAYNAGNVAIATGDDVYSGNIPLGFNFNYFGNDYTQVRISSNGWFSFTLTEAAGFNPNGPIPNANSPLNAILAVHSDLNPSVCGDVRYGTFGTAPCRQFVVSWNNVCQYSCTSQQVSAQIVLYEGTNAIEVYLANRQACTWGNATMGIQNIDGTVGIAAPGFNTGNWNASNVAFRFSSSEVVDGTTLWYQADELLGIGDTLPFCTSSTTTITGWFGQLPVGTFCAEFEVSLPTTGSFSQNNQIDWVLMSDAGAVLYQEGAPFSDDVCLQNGCYTLMMEDSGGDGWGTELTFTGSNGNVYGPFTLESGSGEEVTFCVDDYTGPEPTESDYVQITSDEIEIVAVSDVDAAFTYPAPICVEGGAIQLTPLEGSGTWEVDCDGCFDAETLTLDPLVAGPGFLSVTHTLDGTCFADVDQLNLTIIANPHPQLNDPPLSMCVGDVFDINPTPAFGIWSSDCGTCLANNGYFNSNNAALGENTLTFTTVGACPGDTTIVIGVSEPTSGTVSGPFTVCEGAEVQMLADMPGTWSVANCTGCMAPSGLFEPTAGSTGTYEVTFTPESFCPVDSTVEVNVIPGVGISADNVPPSLCAGTESFQFNTDAPGGEWTADCGGCLSDAGLFTPPAAGYGDVAIMYAVTDGQCADTANWVVEVLPVLEGTVETVPDLCEGSVFNFDFLLDSGIPAEYTTGVSGVWSSVACPDCITNANSGVFSANEPGVIDLVYTFNAACSEPIVATVNVGESVNATISAVPTLCESEDPVVLQAVDGGGTWSSSCSECLTGNVFDPGAIDLDITLGTYTVTYVINDICTDSDQITIEVMPQLDASIILTDEICVAAESVEAGSYIQNGIWSASCGGCIDQDGVIDLQQAGLGLLDVTYTLPGLCGDEQSTTLAVEPCAIEVFNVITPNEDGMNDALVFSNLEGFPGNELAIYDRWGAEVYRATNYNNGWKGVGQAAGTYFYILTIPGLDTVKGTFTLLR